MLQDVIQCQITGKWYNIEL